MRSLMTLLTASLAVSLGWAAPASAQDKQVADPVGDVQFYDSPQDDLPTRVSRTDGDLSSARITYGESRVRAVLRFVDLDRRAPQLAAGIYLSWTSPDGYNFADIRVVATKVHRAGRSRVDGTFGRCAIDSTISYSTDTVSLSFPARCIDRPRSLLAFADVYRTDDVNDPTYWLRDYTDPVRLRRG